MKRLSEQIAELEAERDDLKQQVNDRGLELSEMERRMRVAEAQQIKFVMPDERASQLVKDRDEARAELQQCNLRIAVLGQQARDREDHVALLQRQRDEARAEVDQCKLRIAVLGQQARDREDHVALLQDMKWKAYAEVKWLRAQQITEYDVRTIADAVMDRYPLGSARAVAKWREIMAAKGAEVPAQEKPLPPDPPRCKCAYLERFREPSDDPSYRGNWRPSDDPDVVHDRRVWDDGEHCPKCGDELKPEVTT